MYWPASRDWHCSVCACPHSVLSSRWPATRQHTGSGMRPGQALHSCDSGPRTNNLHCRNSKKHRLIGLSYYWHAVQQIQRCRGLKKELRQSSDRHSKFRQTFNRQLQIFDRWSKFHCCPKLPQSGCFQPQIVHFRPKKIALKIIFWPFSDSSSLPGHDATKQITI